MPLRQRNAMNRALKITPFVIAVFALVVVVALAQRAFEARAAAPGDHGQLVSQTTRDDLPVVANGTVRAHAQVGNRIFVGGDFTTVIRPDGTTVSQPYLFAYDVDSGAFDESFRPALNNTVQALETSADGDALFVGGRFWKWDDSFPIRVAKLHADGSLDTKFAGSANAIVRSIAATDDRVFLAGDFTEVGGEAHLGYAALDAMTGAVDPGFVVDVDASPQRGRRIVATSDGSTVFGLHFGTGVNGLPRDVLVKVDVSGPTAAVADWQVDWDRCMYAIRDLAISPDDSYIAVVTQGGDAPPFCDSVIRYPTAGQGVVPFDWSARMYSSVFSVAISDVAVYAGGHFCAAPKNGAAPGGVTDPDGVAANWCGQNVEPPDIKSDPWLLNPDGAVERNQMAALDPASGRALDWDPGTDAQVGVLEMTIIDRGLLIGQDRGTVAGFPVGRSGFFDFGSTDNSPPVLSATIATDGAALAVSGSLVDDIRAEEITITARHQDGRWLQGDGTLSSAFFRFEITPAADGSFSSTLPAPVGEYQVSVDGSDFAGNSANSVSDTITVASGPAPGECLAAASEAGVELRWGAFNDEDDAYQIRNADGWVANVSADSRSWSGPATDYTIRSREAGQTVDVTCVPAGTPPVVTPPAAGECAATFDGGQMTLNWGPFNGEDDTFQVRNAGGWVATVSSAETSWSGPVDDYSIRSREAGQTVDIACVAAGQPPFEPPAEDPECSAEVNATAITLRWPGFNGEDDGYQIRTGDGWVASLDPAARSWSFDTFRYQPPLFVRSKEAGNTIDLECSWTPPAAPMTNTSVTNLALGRTARQSSIAFDLTPANAVDGSSAPSAQTLTEFQPWWEVDLGSSQAIDTVTIINSLNWNQRQQTPGHLLISDTPMQGRSFAELLADPSVAASDLAINTQAVMELDAGGAAGRYVRIQLSEQGFLDLAEVQITPLVFPENVSVGKPVAQSSVHSIGIAANAVDGILGGRWGVHPVTHTANEIEPWWEIDLGAKYDLDAIELWNRTDCCGNRLNNGAVFISDLPMTGMSVAELEADPNVAVLELPDPEIQTVFDASQLSGRYVRVQLRGQAILQLAEVVVTTR